MTTYQDTSERHRWHDQRMGAALRAHRAAVKASAEAGRTLDQLVNRLKHIDRILGDWDKHHAKLAAIALDAGQHERAAAAAWLLWDDEARRRILAQVAMGSAIDQSAAAERAALNRESGRLGAYVEGGELVEEVLQ